MEKIMKTIIIATITIGVVTLLGSFQPARALGLGPLPTAQPNNQTHFQLARRHHRHKHRHHGSVYYNAVPAVPYYYATPAVPYYYAQPAVPYYYAPPAVPYYYEPAPYYYGSPGFSLQIF
jgi:hypothetical protein